MIQYVYLDKLRKIKVEFAVLTFVPYVGYFTALFLFISDSVDHMILSNCIILMNILLNIVGIILLVLGGVMLGQEINRINKSYTTKVKIMCVVG
jgi:hypothetical protein